MDFKNKVVLITGASSGIGKQTAIEFAKLGSNIILNQNHQGVPCYNNINIYTTGLSSMKNTVANVNGNANNNSWAWLSANGEKNEGILETSIKLPCLYSLSSLDGWS